ncbi:heterokaryon incompatibility protein-domain-containing protein, partial [Boeremia exigua]|uniref:heterokaryon incompatibility protein-domain-containing protein n=1 Tax=Boeremia exigua TaxID=749465 RepID=UPI001E8EC4CC
RYIALSYCWGPKQQDTFLTDAKTFADRKAGFRASDLPPLFTDVLTCARALGIDYIWIDRLCIIQGDASDWSAQAPKMGQYYGNATLSLVAASAESEMDSILVERDPKWRSYGLNIKPQWAPDHSLGLRFRRRPYLLGWEAEGGKYGKVSKRAWIWQERLLAARTVFFTPSALKFECRNHSVWEGYGASVTSPSWTARVEKMTHLDWFTLVQEFSQRDITYSLDRLPAINSVTERI